MYELVYILSDNTVYSQIATEIPAVDLMCWVQQLPIDENGEIFINRIHMTLAS